jgi:hypothetical protein
MALNGKITLKLLTRTLQYSRGLGNSYFRVLKSFEFANESSLSLLPICARACCRGCGLSGFQRQSTVHDSWRDRTVLGARAGAGCTCAEEGVRKGPRCVYIMCCISLDWADSKRRVL